MRTCSWGGFSRLGRPMPSTRSRGSSIASRGAPGPGGLWFLVMCTLEYLMDRPLPHLHPSGWAY